MATPGINTNSIVVTRDSIQAKLDELQAAAAATTSQYAEIFQTVAAAREPMEAHRRKLIENITKKNMDDELVLNEDMITKSRINELRKYESWTKQILGYFAELAQDYISFWELINLLYEDLKIISLRFNDPEILSKVISVRNGMKRMNSTMIDVSLELTQLRNTNTIVFNGKTIPLANKSEMARINNILDQAQQALREKQLQQYLEEFNSATLSATNPVQPLNHLQFSNSIRNILLNANIPVPVASSSYFNSGTPGVPAPINQQANLNTTQNFNQQNNTGASTVQNVPTTTNVMETNADAAVSDSDEDMVNRELIENTLGVENKRPAMEKTKITRDNIKRGGKSRDNMLLRLETKFGTSFTPIDRSSIRAPSGLRVNRSGAPSVSAVNKVITDFVNSTEVVDNSLIIPPTPIFTRKADNEMFTTEMNNIMYNLNELMSMKHSSEVVIKNLTDMGTVLTEMQADPNTLYFNVMKRLEALLISILNVDIYDPLADIIDLIPTTPANENSKTVIFNYINAKRVRYLILVIGVVRLRVLFEAPESFDGKAFLTTLMTQAGVLKEWEDLTGSNSVLVSSNENAWPTYAYNTILLQKYPKEAIKYRILTNLLIAALYQENLEADLQKNELFLPTEFLPEQYVNSSFSPNLVVF